MYNVIDHAILFFFVLSFIGMLLSAVNLIRYMKSRVKAIDGVQHVKPYPSKSLALCFVPLLIVLVLSSVLTAQARGEIKDYFDHIDKATLTIEINGKAARDPLQVLDALSAMPSIAAHHSHPVNRIDVILHDKNGALTLRLGRDSAVAREYWVFYPRYRLTDKNQVYRVNTSLFDDY